MAILSCFLGAIWTVQKKLVQSNFQVTPPQLLTKSLLCQLLQKVKKNNLKRLLKNKKIWRIPIFTGGVPQLLSAILSLTSVFGMGTGVTSITSSPENFI